MKVIELAEWTPDVRILGNVGFRQIRLTGHQSLPGHKHNFPHATVVFRGPVDVTFTYEDGFTETKRYDDGDKFEVPALVKHSITASSEDGAECWCVFGVRDESGEIAELVTDEHRMDNFWHERRGGGDTR